jgi:hypothetical protein
MSKEKILIKMNELKPGDLFSFRTETTPIYWRFVEYRDDKLIYEGIRDNKYQFSSPIRIQNVMVKREQKEPEQVRPKRKSRYIPKVKICAGCGSFAHGNPGHDI